MLGRCSIALLVSFIYQFSPLNNNLFSRHRSSLYNSIPADTTYHFLNIDSPDFSYLCRFLYNYDFFSIFSFLLAFTFYHDIILFVLRTRQITGCGSALARAPGLGPGGSQVRILSP